MAQPVNRVHLIFKTHLDVGFTDYARNVTRHYFEVYIPGAIHTARKMREQGKRFVWTTGSWLIYEYLEQMSGDNRRLLEKAIQEGDIVWHGLPFTTHSELMDAPLFRYGLSLSQQLDRRFDRRTIAAKMTDVPGHTRGIVPLLAKAGITFLHIGVNHASTPPDVPPVFVWRDPSGAEVMVMYHKDYGASMTVPGLDEAIAFAHTGDNLGPQTPGQADEAIQAVQRQFPEAEVVASTLDAFGASLSRVKDQLPVITDELGDTWIHGVGSDPQRVSQFRELLRLRNQWLANDPSLAQSSRFATFSRFLLMVPEHTWGMDIKTHLADFSNYAPQSFQAARHTENYHKVEASWSEQRAYLDSAIKALDQFQQDEAARRLKASAPARPDTANLSRITGQLLPFKTPHFEIGFDADDGSIDHLVSLKTGHVWASPDHPLALFRYQTFSATDYERFYRQYIAHKDDVNYWAIPDFTKPGLAPSEAESRLWTAKLSAIYQWRDHAGQTFLLELTPPPEAIRAYGCPAVLTMQITLPADSPSVHIDFQWFEKPACRLPEALWLSFAPVVENADSWQLDKLGSSISPLKVVPNGNRKLHAVGKGVFYAGPDGSLSLETIDAPLVAPGDPSLLDFNNDLPILDHGMHFNLYNNVWGTNFAMWYSDDARFRFKLTDPAA